jgi:tetratricopeptide (TPR) repeat protein
MTFISNSKFKRAAQICVALFFIMTGQILWARAETYQDLIEKAFQLSIQKDRLQAISVLVGAARKEYPRGNLPKDLAQALYEVSTVFYTDKGQQLFELGLSLKQMDPAMAQTKLNEALRTEPEHLLVLIELARLQIVLNDCDSALKQIQKIRDKNPYFEDSRLAFAQAALCAGKLGDFFSERKQQDEKRRSKDIFWLILDVEHAFKTGAFDRGLEIGQQLQKLDAQFSELYYWNWKLFKEKKLASQSLEAGQKYLAVCKSVTPKALRTYGAEPRVCRRVTEVESEVKLSIEKVGGAHQ